MTGTVNVLNRDILDLLSINQSGNCEGIGSLLCSKISVLFGKSLPCNVLAKYFLAPCDISVSYLSRTELQNRKNISCELTVIKVELFVMCNA